jgi:hypothetical protein
MGLTQALVQLGVNKPSVIPCAAQLLKVLGVDGLTEGSFMPPSSRQIGVMDMLRPPRHAQFHAQLLNF